MATKRKKRRRAKPAMDLPSQTRRFLEKGQYREALKSAKLGYRQQPDPQQRSLLEHALIARGEQLSRGGHLKEARAVLADLVELGVSEPSVAEALPELLASVGLFERALEASDHEGGDGIEAIPASIVDRGILRPEGIPASMAELREGVRQVRRALDLLQSGDAGAAEAQLEAIPRRSPLADWKIFVRGLTACYEQDVPRMRANWKRLDPARLAHRIAQPLAEAAEGGTPGLRTESARLLRTELERIALGEPVLDALEALRAELEEQRWPEALRTFARAKAKLAAVDPRLVPRIARIVYAHLIDAEDPDVIEDAARIAPPLPNDPRWNRARAIVAEGAYDDPSSAERHWLRYLHEDFDQIPHWSGDERRLAHAMVLDHLAQFLVDEAKDHEKMCGDPECTAPDRMREQAVEYLRASIERAPRLTSAREHLAAAYQVWGKTEKAVETFRALLEQEPDHWLALRFLSSHYSKADDPLRALEFAARALRLRPLDADLRQEVAELHQEAARHWAGRKEVQRGREAFDQAERLCPKLSEDCRMLARRATFELAVGDAEQARALADAALKSFEEPTAALLALAIESIRYGQASDGANSYYEHAWRQALKKRCLSSTAGRMAAILMDCLEQRIDYPGRRRHIDAVVAYLARTRRVRWLEEDLREVCRMFNTLLNVEGSDPLTIDLFEKLAKKGTKKFPRSACFHMLLGDAELQRGPEQADLSRALRRFKRAARLAAASSDPRDADLARQAEEAVRTVRKFKTMMDLKRMLGRDDRVTPEMAHKLVELLDVAPE